MRLAWCVAVLSLVPASLLAAQEPRVAVLRPTSDEFPGAEGTAAAQAVVARILEMTRARAGWKVIDPVEVYSTLDTLGSVLTDCAPACDRKIGSDLRAALVVETTLRRAGDGIGLSVRISLPDSSRSAGGEVAGPNLAALIRALNAQFPLWFGQAAAASAALHPQAEESQIRKARERNPEVEPPELIRARVVKDLNLAVLRVKPLPGVSDEARKWIPSLTVTMTAAVKAVVPDLRVMETALVHQILEARGIDVAACEDNLCKKEIGREAGAEYLLEGDLAVVGGAYQLPFKLTVVREGKSTSDSARASSLQALEEDLAAKVRQMARLLDDEIERRVSAIYEPLKIEAADKASKRSFRRKVGWGVIAAAGVGAIFTTYGAVNGLSLNDKVQRGGYDTPAELKEAVDEGQQFNKVVRVVAIGAGAAAVTGVLLVLLNQDPKPLDPNAQPRAAVGVAPGMLVVAGRF